MPIILPNIVTHPKYLNLYHFPTADYYYYVILQYYYDNIQRLTIEHSYNAIKITNCTNIITQQKSSYLHIIKENNL